MKAMQLLAVAVALCSAVWSVDAAAALRGLQSSKQVDASSAATEMLNAVNAERSKQGLPKLCTNSKLQKAAQLHSEDQAKSNKMSHTGSGGSTMGSRIQAQGFQMRAAGENVAMGQRDIASVMQSWMNSDGHRANILGKQYQYFGMGQAKSSSGQIYWTQDFGSSSTESCDDSSGGDGSAPSPSPSPTSTTPTPDNGGGPTQYPRPRPTTTAPSPVPSDGSRPNGGSSTSKPRPTRPSSGSSSNQWNWPTRRPHRPSSGSAIPSPNGGKWGWPSGNGRSNDVNQWGSSARGGNSGKSHSQTDSDTFGFDWESNFGQFKDKSTGEGAGQARPSYNFSALGSGN